MGTIKVLAGDFERMAGGSFGLGILTLMPSGAKMGWGTGRKGFRVRDDIECVELADERACKRVFDSIGSAAIGGLIAGPAGFVAGALLGGRKERVVFVAKFKDGRKLLAECDKSTWIKIVAATF